MPKLKVTNNATSLLSSNIDAVVTTVSITAGDEGKFPFLSGNDWFPITVVDASANREIMRCTARSGVNLTVIRGQEGTTARTFNAGARVDMRLTAAAFDSKADLDSPAFIGVPTSTTPPVGDTSGKIATTEYVLATQGLVPPGAIVFGVMVAVPAGYLICDGAAVSRMTYAALYNAIGATFGAGDGLNTFNLPDFRGQFLRGVDAGRGLDVGRVAGTAQTGAVESHAHTASSGFQSANHQHYISGNPDAQGNHQHPASADGWPIPSEGGWSLRAVGSGTQGYTGFAGTHSHNINFWSGTISANHNHAITVNAFGSGTETRPTNIALNGYIKF